MTVIPVFPNFFVIGAPKSGTTSLAYYLNQHPDIFIPKIKEPDTLFYKQVNGDFIGPSDLRSKRGPRTRAQYLALFANPKNASAIGDASFYLYSETAMNNILDLAPQAKFIIILRNPADRAFSNFVHARRLGDEKIKDFRKALENETRGAGKDQMFFHRYKANGLYTRYIKKYFSAFPRTHFHIILYESWMRDILNSMKRLFEFLNVDPNVSIDTSVNRNPASSAAIPALGYYLYHETPLRKLIKPISEALFSKSFRDNAWRTLDRLNRATPPQFDPSLRRELLEYYRADILDLEKLIQMDLNCWYD